MISFVIPTLNSSSTLSECLDSILMQEYPRNEYEIIIADAGSIDSTLDIAKSKGVNTICSNPLKTGEAGKAAGIKVAKGEFIALVDSDNILPNSKWLTKMMEPFHDDEIFATEPIRYSSRPTDPSLTRYFAELGMNDPVCLFVGNYDRFSAVSGKWTNLNIDSENYSSYLKLKLKDKIPTIGANGFIFRKKILSVVSWEPYFFDIDVAAEASTKGCGAIAKVNTSIVHLYCAKFSDFIRKQKRRITDFLFFAKAKSRSYPWSKQRKSGILFFILSALTFFPLVFQAIKFAIRAEKGNKVLALWHLPVCYATLWIYGLGVILNVIGIKPKILDRTNWQK